MERLYVKVHGEDTDVFAWAAKFGEAKLVRNAVIVYPKDGALDELLRTLNKEHTLLVEAYEKGGSGMNTALVTIVCSTSGAPMRPVRVLRPYAGGAHAMFTSTRLVVVTADRSRNEVAVTLKSVSATETGLKEEIIWKGYPEDLPNRFKKFSAAVKAAVAKANCYHCRHVHYQKEERDENH